MPNCDFNNTKQYVSCACMELFCTNAFIKDFCRQRANFVENRRMPINTSEGEILRSEAFTISGLGLIDKKKDEKHVGKLSGKNATKKGVY